MSAKKNSKRPVNIAPITVVPTTVVASGISEKSTVPSIPVTAVETAPQLQLQPCGEIAEDINKIAINPIATPSVTHKNAGVNTIVSVIDKNAATTPIIRLATTAKNPQLTL